MDKYQIIYADPPWNFKTYSEKGMGRSASQHYKIMSKEDIQKLPIQNLCANDCALFLWATYPCLEEALELIKAWGFTYRTVAFTWVKTTKNNKFHFGLGYWTRANPEICILATKGTIKRISASVTNLQIYPVREHSRKPDEVRDRIVELLGDLPRIELFARQKTEGWDVWGNEVDSDIDIHNL